MKLGWLWSSDGEPTASAISGGSLRSTISGGSLRSTISGGSLALVPGHPCHQLINLFLLRTLTGVSLGGV